MNIQKVTLAKYAQYTLETVFSPLLGYFPANENLKYSTMKVYDKINHQTKITNTITCQEIKEFIYKYFPIEISIFEKGGKLIIQGNYEITDLLSSDFISYSMDPIIHNGNLIFM